MYESPIEKIYGDIQSQIIKQDEENIMYSVNQAVGYSVDKNELIKALKYDREQYNKGYHDGRADAVDKAYQRGLEDAWELARKLYNLGFNDKRKEIFGEKYGLSIDIIKDFSVDEVMNKIKDMPIKCDILNNKCPYHGIKCPDCNLRKAFDEAKNIGGNA